MIFLAFMSENMPMMRRAGKQLLFALLACVALCGAASARGAGGRLGFIVTPNSTRPAFALPGEKITVDVSSAIYNNCTCVFHLYLEKDGARTEMPATRIEGTDTYTYRFEVAIPPGTAPGLYSVAAHKGANSDTSVRAVAVLSEYPSEYTIMHITDTHVGRMAGERPFGEEQYRRLAEKVNELRPALVVITGDVTDTSEPSQFQKFLEVTDTMQVPTVALPGNHDRNYSGAHTFLGPGRFTFMFGTHFYLGFDTQYEFPPNDPDGQMKWITREMKAHDSAPFKCLLSHRTDSDYRLIVSRVILPLKVNLFLMGHYHTGEDNRFGGGQRMLVTPASVDGNYSLIKIKDNKIADVQVLNIEK